MFIHSQAIQDVDDFVSSSEQIWKNLALHHTEWESKQLIITSQ